MFNETENEKKNFFIYTYTIIFLIDAATINWNKIQQITKPENLIYQRNSIRVKMYVIKCGNNFRSVNIDNNLCISNSY